MKLFIIFSLFFNYYLLADSVGVEIISLTIHVSDNSIVNGDQYPRKLDDNGRVILMPGVEVNYHYKNRNNFLSIDNYKIMLGNYSDSRAQHSGYLQFGPRWNFSYKKISIDLGLGPVIFFRESWKKFPDYPGNDFLYEAFGYEYLIFIFGDIDFQFKISKNLKLVWSIIPAIPFSIANSFGVDYQF